MRLDRYTRTNLVQMGNGQDPHRNIMQVRLHFYPVHQRTIIEDELIINSIHLKTNKIKGIVDNITTSEYKSDTDATSVSATAMNPFNV